MGIYSTTLTKVDHFYPACPFPPLCIFNLSVIFLLLSGRFCMLSLNWLVMPAKDLGIESSDMHALSFPLFFFLLKPLIFRIGSYFIYKPLRPFIPRFSWNVGDTGAVLLPFVYAQFSDTSWTWRALGFVLLLPLCGLSVWALCCPTATERE